MKTSQYRADFPIFKNLGVQREFVYLDSAATTLKPQSVISAIDLYYSHVSANVHRAVYKTSEIATAQYEGARETVRRFINAKSSKEIIFTSGTTQAINLVAQSFGRSRFQRGDEILVSNLEHHSNIVPWQMLCEQVGCTLRVIPVNDDGDIDLKAYASMLNAKTKMVALVYISNAFGTVNPIEEMIAQARKQGACVLIDAAQAMAHRAVDVQALDCDFMAFSGHKMFAETGVGVLYGKQAHLEAMPPYLGGGDMILSVTFEKTQYAGLPSKFEAGTPHISGAISLGAACDYITEVGFNAVREHEKTLLAYAEKSLAGIKGLRIVGKPKERSSAISFVLDDIHPHDLGTMLDQQGVSVRTGHHCAQPMMKRMGVAATARCSVALYNQQSDIDALCAGLLKAKEFFA